ncbi:aminotransferase class III-fold pyridoxal phosphate-dependent enzyme [Oleidesulfovibrio alaskensis]|jgi:glutamate-1-semialdehyde 2,1-aminomutase|uniref:aminotransferase class III-fold pyridoxal phosphate-dependent enzyme n=1 Tax=Oleidesulfovibrio alaskensis TaxID=58180 RepID=UPI00041605C2|nr:aminotransferase class III-fold pyridoxal phosphate-dependent enzyme [Oleidesulfovibrio alaskensis]
MSRCSEYQAKAKQRIPNLTQLLSKNPTRFGEGVWPTYYSKAKGAYIWDLDGHKYLDMSIAGIGACVLGYADEDVDDAVCAAVRQGVASSLNCPEEVELADLLCELHPWAEQARFARSGGEAMAVAVRIARTYTGKGVVLFCGYHGWQDWYLAANLSDESALDGHLMKGLPPAGVPRSLCHSAYPFRYNDIEGFDALVAEHQDNLAAIVTEPVRNFTPDPAFLARLRDVATRLDVPLVVDEISAGLRFTTGGAHLCYDGFIPDIAVFSKALANGYAMSAIIGTQKVMSAASDTFISSTNWTERIGPVAAIATLKKHQRLNLGSHLVRIGTRVQDGWLELGRKHGLPVTVSGMKPMGHFSFGEDHLVKRAFFIQLMLERGILASTDFYAMGAHTPDHVEEYLSACDEVFGIIAETGDIRGQLKGQPCLSGFQRLT